MPRSGRDGLRRRTLDGCERGGVRHAAGVLISIAWRALARRQEDRRTERGAVEVQIQQARGEDRAVGGRLLNAGIAVDTAVVEIRVIAAGGDIRADRVVAIGAEKVAANITAVSVSLSRLEFGAGPLIGDGAVGVLEVPRPPRKVHDSSGTTIWMVAAFMACDVMTPPESSVILSTPLLLAMAPSR